MSSSKSRFSKAASDPIAKKKAAAAAAATAPASTCKVPRATFAAGSSSVVNRERLLEAEDAHMEFLQSELAKINAIEQFQKVSRAAKNDCMVTFKYHSKLAGDLKKRQMKEDELRILTNFYAKVDTEIASMKAAAAVLPHCAEKLSRLANAVTNSQNCLKVLGARADPDNELARLEQSLGADSFNQLVQKLDGSSASVAAASEAVAQLKSLLRQTMDSYATCGALLAALETESVIGKSLKMSLEPRVVPDLNLEIPPPVAPPKLVDI